MRRGVSRPVLYFALVAMAPVWAYNAWTLLNSNTYGTVGLSKLEHAFSTIPLPGATTQRGKVESVSRYTSLHVSASYITSLPQDLVRAHYSYWLESQGWKRRDTTGRSMTYCKGTLDADVSFSSKPPGYSLHISERSGPSYATGC